MSTPTTPELSGKIQSIEQQVDALRAAINSARKLRIIIFLVLIALLIAIVVLFMSLAKRVTSKEFVNEVAELSQKHFTENQAVYQSHVQQFVDRSYPIVTGAFQSQSTKDLPKFTEAFNEQRDTFVTNLRTRMDEKLTKKYQDLLVQHENQIASEFPELKDKESRDRILANFQFVIERLVKRNYGDQFNDEAKTLIALWDAFPAVADPGPNEPKLEERLLENLLFVATGVMTTMQQNGMAQTSATDPTAPAPTGDQPAAGEAPKN